MSHYAGFESPSTARRRYEHPTTHPLLHLSPHESSRQRHHSHHTTRDHAAYAYPTTPSHTPPTRTHSSTHTSVLRQDRHAVLRQDRHAVCFPHDKVGPHDDHTVLRHAFHTTTAQCSDKVGMLSTRRPIDRERRSGLRRHGRRGLIRALISSTRTLKHRAKRRNDDVLGTSSFRSLLFSWTDLYPSDVRINSATKLSTNFATDLATDFATDLATDFCPEIS